MHSNAWHLSPFTVSHVTDILLRQGKLVNNKITLLLTILLQNNRLAVNKI